MRCIVCKHGQTRPGTATVSVDRDGAVVVVRAVPAEICATCGEDYLDADVVRQIERLVGQVCTSGIDVAVQHYRAA